MQRNLYQQPRTTQSPFRLQKRSNRTISVQQVHRQNQNFIKFAINKENETLQNVPQMFDTNRQFVKKDISKELDLILMSPKKVMPLIDYNLNEQDCKKCLFPDISLRNKQRSTTFINQNSGQIKLQRNSVQESEIIYNSPLKIQKQVKDMESVYTPSPSQIHIDRLTMESSQKQSFPPHLPQNIDNSQRTHKFSLRLFPCHEEIMHKNFEKKMKSFHYGDVKALNYRKDQIAEFNVNSFVL